MGAAEWCGRPIVAGEWRELEGAELAAMIAEIRSAALDRRDALVIDAQLERVRVLPLACYSRATLVEAQARIGDRPGLSNHLKGPWGLITLNGESAPIHDLNDEGELDLETEAQARAYHALFCNAVRGDHGRFHILTDANELLWRAPPEDCVFASISIAVKMKRVADGWEIEAPIVYEDNLFTAWFKLEMDGTIEMVGDNPVAAEMPIAVETWSAQYRLPPLRRMVS